MPSARVRRFESGTAEQSLRSEPAMWTRSDAAKILALAAVVLAIGLLLFPPAGGHP